MNRSITFYVAKDSEGNTVQRAVIPTEAEAWDFTTQLLAREEAIKRVIFYDSQFAFVNALSKPTYLKHEDDVISEEDKQALLILEAL